MIKIIATNFPLSAFSPRERNREPQVGDHNKEANMCTLKTVNGNVAQGHAATTFPFV